MASIDVDLGPIEVMASIGTEVRKMNDNFKKWRQAEMRRSQLPSDDRINTSVTIPTPTARTGISLGGPSAGYYWLLRRLIVGGTTFKTTAAGTAEVYVTGLGSDTGSAITGPIITALALTDLVDQATTLPNKAFYSNRQVIVQANENLMVVIDSGTAGQLYIASAQFEVHRTVNSETTVYD